jgi:hypothetical protein
MKAATNYLSKALPEAVHLALDAWALSNGSSFLGIVALFLDPNPSQEALTEEGDNTNSKKALVPRPPIKTLILDFVTLNSAHTGDYLADKLSKVLKEFDIEKKVRFSLSTGF